MGVVGRGGMSPGLVTSELRHSIDALFPGYPFPKNFFTKALSGGGVFVAPVMAPIADPRKLQMKG